MEPVAGEATSGVSQPIHSSPVVDVNPGTAYFLRVSRDRWDDMEIDNLVLPTVTVVGAWLVMAWARFGTQIVDDFRAVLRFVLVGVYGWLALSLAVYLLQRFVSQPTTGAGHRSAGATGPPMSPLEHATANVGLAHQALVVGGFAIQVVQILPFQTLTTILAVSSILWMAGQLLAAVASFGQTSLIAATPSVGVVWLGWLGTVGVYFWSRLGHLV